MTPIEPWTAERALAAARDALRAGRVREAAMALREGTRVAPDDVRCWVGLAEVLVLARDFAAAKDAATRAVELRGESAPGWCVLGHARGGTGDLAGAIEAYQRAVTLKGDHAEAWTHLAHAAKAAGKRGLAIDAFRAAVRLSPHDVSPHGNLAHELLEAGFVEEAVESFRRVLRLDPNLRSTQSDLLLAMNFSGEMTDEQIAAEHRKWGTDAEWRSGAVRPHENDLSPGRRIRIGYVSADFREHVVWKWLEPVFARHDREKFEIVCYSATTRPDAVTERAKHYAKEWRDISRLPDADAAETVRHDRIDVLLDLGGHTWGNRLGIFARKPAPVQVTYLGYPGTTGLSRIDYLITDDRLDPPGKTERLHTETLVRLPECFSCYAPTSGEPEVSPPPALHRGYVTFGSFNYLPKMSAATVNLWSRVMTRVPGSKLLLKSDAVAPDDRLAQHVRSRFEARGVEGQRITLVPWKPGRGEHLATYGDVDVALDMVPYNGTTTTCEAVWMGVPVVTLAGTAHRSRVGGSLLNAMGLKELVAETEEQFVEIATRLASDVSRLASARGQLRGRMSRSRLADADAFVGDYERALQGMWETYRSGRAGVP